MTAVVRRAMTGRKHVCPEVPVVARLGHCKSLLANHSGLVERGGQWVAV
jgi:hypothetical protein